MVYPYALAPLPQTENLMNPNSWAIDLFSGSGGLTLGLKQAGFKVIGAVENDLLAVETYQRNHPEVQVWDEDVKTVEPSDVMELFKLQPGDLALLSGCPPCQGFSSLRTLNGSKTVEDERNDLLFDFLRFTEVIKPKAVMVENVPGLVHDGRFLTFLERLDQLGYKWTYDVLNAADYEVPQRRFRLIILASLERSPQFRKPNKPRRTVRDAIADLETPGESGDLLHDLPEIRSQRVMDLIKRIPKNGGSRTDLDDEFQLACHKSCNGFRDIYGRMAWDDIAPTITGGCFNPSKGRFLHPEQNRAITLREAVLLQGFPPNYFISLERGKSRAAVLIGNAFPPAFAEHHASSFAQA